MKLFGIWLSTPDIADLRAREKTDDIIDALSHPSPVTRADAAAALRDMKVPEALKPLRKALSDRDPHVRAAAIETLREMRDQEAVEPLGAVLMRHPDEGGREAARALGLIGGPRAVSILIQALSRASTRTHAAEGLRECGDERARQPLRDSLRRSGPEDAPFIMAAAEALHRLEDDTAAGLIGEALARIPAGSEAAARVSLTLGRFGQVSAVSQLCTALVNERLSATLRRDIAECLGAFPGDQVVHALCSALEIGGSETMLNPFEVEVKVATAGSLARIADPAAVPPLCALLERASTLAWPNSDKLKEAALRALAPVADERAVDVLCAELARAPEPAGQEGERLPGDMRKRSEWRNVIADLIVEILRRVGGPRAQAAIAADAERTAAAHGGSLAPESTTAGRGPVAEGQ